MKIKARTMPRDVLDVLIAVPVATLQLAAAFGLPTLIVAVTVNSAAGVLAFVVMYIVWLLFTVRSLDIDQNGMHFRRVFGNPTTLPWSRIDSVEEVSRREVVLHGWLWPLFPAREMTACLSAKHHFRIRWPEGFCYYPPDKVDEFKSAVSEFIKDNGAPTTPPTVFSTRADAG
jgi:hypothetical protein